MKRVGLLSLYRFPLWRKSFDALCTLCEEVYVRIDRDGGDPEIVTELKRTNPPKLKGILISETGWKPPNWHEELLRLLDDVKPDTVIAPDEDEIFEDSLEAELTQFEMSEKRAMLFEYVQPMPTADGRVPIDGAAYPPEPHTKVFKWQPGLSYYPWHRSGCVANYFNPKYHWKAKTKIKHYCLWTPQLEALKKWRSEVPGRKLGKAVTLMGFGPSSFLGPEKRTFTEIWSLNDAYQVHPEVLRYTTRFFDIHDPEKRRYEIANDGHSHFWHLNELGERGHRIIMQQAMPEIANSEAYPYQEIVRELSGVEYFTGQVAYMLAMAIREGYTQIQILGFDQVDWEHVLQRESFIFWVGYAMARGIVFSGHLAFLEGLKRYGYDYGPEWGEWQQQRMWRGWPFELNMKTKPQSMAGELFGNVKT